MKRGPIAAILILGGIALFLVPPIHAMVREANALFALGIAQRAEASGPRPSVIEAYAYELPPIPSAMHWIGFLAGAICLLAGITIALRATRT